MDRVLTKKKWTVQRIATSVGIAALVVLMGASYYFTSGKSRLNADKSRLTMHTIAKGTFQEFIPVNGAVLPMSTIYLDAMEGGRVEEKYVEDGAILKKGDPVIRLANTDLELTLANQEIAVFEVLTQMQNTKNNAQQNTINKLNQMAEVESTLQEAERVYRMNKKLYGEKVIALQEFTASDNLYNYQVRRKKLTDRVLKQDSLTNGQQLAQMNESYRRMKNALALMQKKVGDLIVRAPVDGQLTAMDVEIGQSKNKGERLGQLDVLSGFKVRADIDQHYISRIFTGLKGNFTFNNQTYELKIKKIFTQVANGRFMVDMDFSGPLPQGIRHGQTLQIRLALSDETQAVLVDFRPCWPHHAAHHPADGQFTVLPHRRPKARDFAAIRVSAVFVAFGVFIHSLITRLLILITRKRFALPTQ